MKLGVVVNGAAGGGRCRVSFEAIRPRLEAAHAVTVAYTGGPGEGARLAGELAAAGVDTVMSVGGDGTLFEVVNGLISLEAPPRVALMPLGTGNSFGRDFGILDAEGALAALGRCPRRFDVVKVTHRDGVVHYVNLLSVGFAAEVGALTNRRFKPVGALGYILAVLVQVTRLAPRSFPHDPGHGTDAAPVTLLSFSNTQCTGGEMRMAPDADPTDGAVDLVRIGAMGRRRLLSCFPKLFAGTHVDMPEVTVEPVQRCTFSGSEAVEVMLDGEIQRLQIESLEVLPGALELWT